MYGKLLIRCDLVVRTGLHIGGSNGYSPIGTVDSPVVRDPLTGMPIVPGSSLKGKLRALLARSAFPDTEKMPELKDEPETLQRLFGSANPPRAARLQFADAFVRNAAEMKGVGLTEVKAENTIDRASSEARPRQIERVVAGVVFGVSMTYQISTQEQAQTDMALLAKGLRLLQMDYLGGHGSRGSGRVSLCHFTLETFGAALDIAPLEAMFREVEAYELLAL